MSFHLKLITVILINKLIEYCRSRWHQITFSDLISVLKLQIEVN